MSFARHSVGTLQTKTPKNGRLIKIQSSNFKEYFKNAVKRAAEGRLTWLTEQATKTDQTAQSMYKKADKI